MQLSHPQDNNNSLSLKNLLTTLILGVLVTVVSAWIIQDARFAHTKVDVIAFTGEITGIYKGLGNYDSIEPNQARTNDLVNLLFQHGASEEEEIIYLDVELLGPTQAKMNEYTEGSTRVYTFELVHLSHVGAVPDVFRITLREEPQDSFLYTPKTVSYSAIRGYITVIGQGGCGTNCILIQIEAVQKP